VDLSIGPAGGIAAMVGAAVAAVAPGKLAPSLAALTLMTAGLLFAHGIRMVFGNVRASLRAALKKLNVFTLIDEPEFLTYLTSLRKLRT
jgi:hypothetical protein